MTEPKPTLYSTRIDSPCGPLLCVVDATGAVVRIEFAKGRTADQVRRDLANDKQGKIEPIDDAERTAALRQQLEEFFAGERHQFDLPLAPRGTEFQRAAWRQLREIPYGETRSYGEMAAAMGRPKASRAVGRANATNPIPILVPCHRVIGADGSLTGFGGGLDAKVALLELEARHSTQPTGSQPWQRRLPQLSPSPNRP